MKEGIAIGCGVLLSFFIGAWFGVAAGQSSIATACNETGQFTLLHPMLPSIKFFCNQK